MFAKIEITGTITVETGMHIGGSSEFSAIGAVDSPVVKDSVNGNPMIPGSSLKGKLRTLMAKRYNTTLAKNYDDDCEELLTLFGSSKKTVRTGKLLFRDMIMENVEELRKMDVRSTEIKFENNINRATAVANPRQIERVVRGAKFPMNLIYELSGADTEEMLIEHMKMLKEGFKLLEYDYLGGSGSRGYGKVSIDELQFDVVIGEVTEATTEICRAVLGAE